MVAMEGTTLIFQLVKSNITDKKSRTFLTVFSISVSVLLMLVIISLSMQINSNIIKNAQYYDVLIGEKGSSTQLALNTFFFYDVPIGNIDLDYYTNLQNDPRVNTVVPISMGDNYKGYKIIGTTQDYFSNPIFKIKSGNWYRNIGEVIIGQTVAKKTGLKIGAQFTGMHGITSTEEHFHDETHDSFKYTVVGILDFSGTPNDIAVFTNIQSVWSVHGITIETLAESATSKSESSHVDDEHEHEHEHGHGHELITALLVKSKSLGDAFTITQEYNDKTDIQAINPASTIRKVMDSVDTGQKVLTFIAGICIILSIITLFIVMLSAASERNKDVALLRVLGARRKTVFQLVVFETFILSCIGCICGFIFSRVFLIGLGEYIKGEIGLNLSAFSISGYEAILLIFALILCTMAGLLPGILVYKKRSGRVLITTEDNIWRKQESYC